MNTNKSRSTHWLPGSARLALLAFTVLSLAAPVRAQVDYTLNENIWKMLYGVSTAQAGSGAWLAADDDMDGVSNGSEKAAGTNPFNAGSTINVSGIAPAGANVDLTFPTKSGKQYVVQTSPSLATPSWASGASVTGNGSPMTLSAPKVDGAFFRILVQDIDTDGDQASNWAEKVAGYDPNTANTNGSPTNDHAALAAGVATSNVVTVVASEVTATQPPNAATAPVDTGRIVIRRSGPLFFNAITVPLQKLGTAVENTDYDLLPGSVFFAADASEVTLPINPKANASRKTNVTAIVKALAGLNYTLGGTTSGSVVIFPAGTNNGTGLTGQYQNTANATYSTQTSTIFSSAAEMTRTDGTINFPNGVNGWGAVGGPTGLSAPSTTGAFSVRWTGQILPQYSETYYIDFRSDDSAKVWVNGRLLIDRWTTQTATDYINTIDLQAGVLYDIQIDYWNSATGTAEAGLYWYSASQVRQIVPQTRLFPAPALASKVTAVTSSLEAVGYEGTPFSFSVTNPDIGGAVTYALDANSAPLPPGLTLTGATGVIAGTPTLAGSYNVAINAQNTAAGVTTGSSVVNFIIYPVGGVTREVLAATGSNIASIVIPAGDPGHTTIATADDDTDHPNNTGKRLRGYFVPPKTGNYYFWVAANNAAELWISNDAESANKVRRSLVAAPTGSGKKAWNAQAAQRSAWLYFVGGQKYYFEVLHNTGADADDHVAVGWCQDDVGTVPAVASAANPNGTPAQIPNGGAALQGYPLSGAMPGYAFQPFDYPATVASTGTLYACNLGPQGGAATTASGSASLRVNAAGTQAILKFEYQGLSSPKVAYHLHVDGYETHSAGEIIFDIDDIDSFHPELRPSPGEYIWIITPGGTFPTAASLVDAIQRNKVYLNIHSALYPAGEIRGTFGLVSGSQAPPDPAAYVDPGYADDHATDAGAARFLNQASFGASPADIAFVKANGFAAWITNQLAQPNSSTSADVVALLTADINNPYPSVNFVNTWWKKAITGQDQLRQRLAFALSEIMVVSYANDTGPLARNARVLADYYDNLIDNCLPTAGLSGSGSFLGLLKAVSLTPAMGLYLDMRANQLADVTIGRHPNENYAREILQLFSVGLYARWDDGKLKLDSKANLIPTYGQEEVLGFSATLTGWNYGQPLQASGRLPTNFGPGADYLNPMMLVPTRHERARKLLLDRVVLPPATGQTPRVNITGVSATSPANVSTGTQHGLKVGDTVTISGVTGGTYTNPTVLNAAHVVTAVPSATSFRVGINCTVAPTANTGTVTGATVIAATSATTSGFTTAGLTPITGSQADNAGSTVPHPYDQYGLTELTKAHDNITNNDAVPPYICYQLIQRLVKSSPSPGYLYRVVQKFRDNGAGVRGDLAAVVTQILLDGEARNSAAAFATNFHGKQREPLLRVTGPARSFPATPYTGTYTQLTGSAANRLRIVTSTPNDFSSAFNVSLDFKGNYVPAGQSLTPYNNPTSTAYSVVSTLGIAGVAVGNPATVTTQSDHGLTTGDSVTIAGVAGGTTSPSINATYTVTVTGPNTFTTTPTVNCTVATTANTGTIVGANTLIVSATGISTATYAQSAGSNVLTVNMAGPPTNVTVLGAASTVNFTALAQVSNPCILTATGHGLTTGQYVLIAGITDGAFSPSINTTLPVTVIDGNTFTVPVNCTTAPTVLGNFRRTAKSRVHVSFLSQTAVGGAAIAADQVYDVDTNGTNIFTIITADTPATARAGLVMIPRIASSFTVQSATVVRLNTNVNHNLQAAQHVWIDTPVAGGAPVDGEFNVIGMTDEDHFTVTYPPVYPVPNGAYSNPSGSQNGVTIWPLVPPPTGRSGVVTVNQSTFVCNGTNGVLSQTPFNAPTVFNFFYPDYKYPGTLANNNVDSPEFQLSTDTDIVNLTNSLTNMFIGTGGGNGNLNGLSSFNNGGGAVVFDIGEFMTAAQTSNAAIPSLIDKISDRLVGGPLTPGTKTAIQNLVANSTNFPYTTPTNQQMRDRVRAIIHQITISAEYAVQK